MARQYRQSRGIRRQVRQASRRHTPRWFEKLEDRSLLSGTPLAAGMIPQVFWAPNTPDSVVQQSEAQIAALGADINSIDAGRWTNTATNGGGLGQGQPTTLTWSLMPDGTEIDGFNFEEPGPSDLQARLDSIYGSMSTWFPLIQGVFDRWESLTGIDFVYEPNDDGSPLSQINVGQLGLRGDIRIGGHEIDGTDGILAYNFFAEFGGDMVIDTSDAFFDDLSGDSLHLRNTIAHEVGHGIGLRHTIPIVRQKLMEPFFNAGFDGPQHDDILRVNRGYGDALEDNDTAATATDIGVLTVLPVLLGEADADGNYAANSTPLSIDDDSDVDYYRFNVADDALVNLRIEPVAIGLIYGTGIQGSTIELFRSYQQSDLSLTVLAADGTTVVASANNTGLGEVESLVDLGLAEGEYFIRVNGAQNAAQLYTLTATSDQPVPPSSISGTVWNDTDSDGTRDGGEPGLADWTVFLDADSDGELDGGEISVVTGTNGVYTFEGLSPGSYTVAIVVQPEWEQTFPGDTQQPEAHLVTLPVGQSAGDIDFGAHQPPDPSPAPTPPTVTNRTPADGATVTTSAINIDITFSETVSGVDITDLVLTGAGAASATVAAPVNTSGNVWRFAVSNLQNGPVNISLAPDANDIEDNEGTDLAPVSWSFTVAISATPQPPVLAPIGNQTMPTSQDTLELTLSATDPNNDPLTFTAVAQSLEYHLDQTLGLGNNGGNQFFNWAGRNEKWFTGSGNTWYYITPDGKLYRWLGGNVVNDPVVEQVSTAAYTNTALLYNAQPNNAPATVSINGSTLVINPNSAFVGKFYVTATVSDGALSDSEAFSVTVQPGGADTTPPTITARTPANGATITTSTINIDITFSEAVTGVDITDLVLTGAGAAGATAAAPVNTGGNVWRFALSNLKDGPVNISLAPDANDIEDAAGNDLAPATWTFTVDTAPPTITARTPANGATITTAATNIDVTFSEAVTGVDITDLVLTGAGAASATVAAPVNTSGNVWRFAVSNLQNGPVNISLAPDANDIEDAVGNDLAPASWSFTVDIGTPPAQEPPVLAPIGDQTMPTTQDTLEINLSASDVNNDPLTFTAVAQSIEFHLDQTLGLGNNNGNDFFNWGGRNEKWLTGSGNTWYYITPDGKLYRWLGGNLANDPLIEQVSVAAYANTALLHNAQPNNAPATVTINGSTLTINPNAAFVGKFRVTVTVNDGQGGTDSEAFFVTVT